MYHLQTLPNGVRLIAEHVPGVRSAALGLWVGTGSRHEGAKESGAAHFIEHMLFKGTNTRSAAQLAMEMDAIGGQMNAFTSKESTCFYARTLDTHLAQAADILCDMFFSSRFDDSDADTERGVILEEIGMYEDAPEDLCAERLAAAVYQGTPLARPILGKAATLKHMTGSWLKAYQQAHYLPGQTVVALSGSFTPKDVDDLAARFSALAPGPVQKQASGHYRPAVTVKKKAIEQNHLTLAFPGLTYNDPRRYTLQLLSFLLGGGMSSRLFQEVREKQGLCYSVYSYGAGHSDTGLFAIYTALGKETEAQALDTILQVVADFAAHGVTQTELERAREQSKASVLMGLESTQARMSHLGRSLLLGGEVLSPDQIIAAYDAVTREDILTLAQTMFRFDQASLSAVGRIAPAEAYRERLCKPPMSL